MFLRISSGIRAIGLVSFLWCLLVLPSQLKAQGYPQVYFLSHLQADASGGEMGGPDWAASDHNYYIFEPGNPLLINSVRRTSDLWGEDYHTHYDTLFAFPGFLEQHADYFKVCTPNGDFYQTPRFRVATIDYQGYYREDHYYVYPWSHIPRISIWYQYNTAMRQIGRMTKYNRPDYLQWIKQECLLDSLGHRLQDIQYTSPDSLTWTPYRRNTYLYSSEPLGFDFKFEKHLPYIPNSADMSSFLISYLDWEFKLMSITQEGADSQGNWIAPQTWNLNYIINADEVNVGGLSCYLNGLVKISATEYGGYLFDWLHTSTVENQENLNPSAPKIAIYPNPTLQQAMLQLSLPKALPIKVQTYNLKGQLLKSEVLSGIKAGINEFPWTATDSQNIPLPSGIYLIRCEWEKGQAVGRIAVVK